MIAGDPKTDNAIFCEQVFYGWYESRTKRREHLGNRILQYLGAFSGKEETEGKPE